MAGPAAPGSPIPWTPLAAYLVTLAALRFGELWLSSRNVERLTARGGLEYGARHFPLIVALHSIYPVALVAEIWRGARPGASWSLWLALWLVAQALRFASMHALGERWTARIVVVPGEPLVRSGVYRWLPHPSYLAVAIEFLAAPLVFGAWRTALGSSILNALLLAVRIPAEERALRAAGTAARR